ncbi:hypothetical protein DSO57_1020433 [Entomophthora muscae]|uniref:Uncharacterized protein n=1 Tax=Entomophthora muscae TaxID=34485 RepID=A0ACC2TRP4_9FUNG|nr:hypothetical protein DSO57_1020433 [Entomophthora muscae]
MSVLGTEKKVVLHLNISPSDTAALLKSAQTSFFYYFNPFVPLFTRYGYDRQPRSLFLQFSVWRVGLQFVADSKLRDSLLEFIDNKLLEMLRPSALAFTLDSLQGLLLLFMVVNRAPLLKKREAMHGLIQVLFFALGLHSQSTTFNGSCLYSKETIFERELAKRIVICYFSFYFWSVGEPVFTLGCMTNEKKNEFFVDTFLRKVKERSRATRNPGHDPYTYISFVKGDSNNMDRGATETSLYLSPEAINWESLDCSLLYISKYLNDEAVNMLEHHFKLNFSPKNITLDYLEETLGETLLKLQELFFSCINDLRTIQRKSNPDSKPWVDDRSRSASHSRQPYPNINLRFYKDGSLEYTQMIVFVVLRYHFSQLELLKAAVRVEAESNPTDPSRSPRVRLSPNFIIVGLRSAVQIIRINKLLGNGPFLFMKYNFLFVASQFIMQYYHVYNSAAFTPLVPISETSNPHQPLDLRSALRSSKGQLESSPTSYFTYQLQSLSALLNALLAHHGINLDS